MLRCARSPNQTSPRTFSSPLLNARPRRTAKNRIAQWQEHCCNTVYGADIYHKFQAYAIKNLK
jgi:hypothetical protein